MSVRRPRRRRVDTSPKVFAWRRSAAFREAAARGLANAREVLKTKPRCGARAKSTGMPCRAYAMANGRCVMHGGRTPKGERWHKIRLPERGETRGIEKFDVKMREKEKRDAGRKARLAAMKPEERERHLEWHRTHRPGSPGERARLRQQRASRDLVEKLLPRNEPPAEDVFA